MKRFSLLALVALILVGFNMAYPSHREYQLSGQKVTFSRHINLEKGAIEYYSGDAKIENEGYLIVAENDDKLVQYYVDEWHLRRVKVFEGPIYHVVNGSLKETGYSHQLMSQSIDDHLQCAIFDQLMGLGGCTSFTQEIEWYTP